MILLLTLFLVAGVIFLVLTLQKGLWPAMAATLLATMILFPRRLTNNSTVENTGLAGSAPDLYSYSLVIFGAAVLLIVQGKRAISRIFIPFIFLLMVCAAFVWDRSSLVQAGLLQLTLGLLAWGVGMNMGKLSQTDVSFGRFFSNLIVLVIVVETIVGLAQLSGVSLNAMDPSTAALMGNRVNGTMNHPNNLGKILLFLIILLLPYIRSSDKKIRQRSIGGIFLAFLPMAMTGGRATFIAAIMVVLLTGVLSRGIRGRLAIPLGVIVLVLPFIGSMWQRFEEDPEGGSRGYLLDIAMRQISARPWEGIGPNSYVSLVGLTDALTATGLPVHNSFLLTAAELGIPTAAALFVPMLYLVLLAWKKRSSDGYIGASAVAYLAAAPGLILVAATGWGMLSTSILPLWFLTLGYISGPFTQRLTGTGVFPDRKSHFGSDQANHYAGRSAFVQNSIQGES